MVQYHVPVWDFYKIWDGGLVFYGSVIGGAVGYFLAYFLVLQKYGISNWQMADIIAPCTALGLALGRVGCLLNGCCYGNVACPDCPSVSFPLPSPPRVAMVARGYQTAAGFTVESWTPVVSRVEPGSPASAAGLRPGDQIIKVGVNDVAVLRDLDDAFRSAQWPRGQNELTLTVKRGGEPVRLPPFVPRTVGLHPTQVYESVSMVFVFLLLMAYYPFRRRDGEVMVLFMVCYGVHRFLNEMLRVDTDPVAFGMTLSQNISVAVLLLAALLMLVLWRRPAEYQAAT
jgi:phosphatidylglycerol:prolipoprotein diacylglycerol transferase